jgi:hypothetical protein
MWFEGSWLSLSQLKIKRAASMVSGTPEMVWGKSQDFENTARAHAAANAHRHSNAFCAPTLAFNEGVAC